MSVPLTRDSITSASVVMLPVYVALFTVVGGNYLITPASRLNDSPTLAYASDLMSLRVWSIFFIVIAVMMMTAMVRSRRTVFRYALWLGIVCMGAWALLFVAAAVWSTASPGAWAWPAFVAAACYASARSLTKGERD